MPSLDETDAISRSDAAPDEEDLELEPAAPSMADLRWRFELVDGWIVTFLAFQAENSSRLAYEWECVQPTSVVEIKASADYKDGILSGLYVSLKFRRKLAQPKELLGFAAPLHWDELYVWYEYKWDEAQKAWIAEMHHTGERHEPAEQLLTADGAWLARLTRLVPGRRSVEIDFSMEQGCEAWQRVLHVPLHIRRIPPAACPGGS
jgi:hypothetical protein